MIISHARPNSPTRLEEPLRFKVSGEHSERSIRFAYKVMRRDGVSAFWARHLVIALLRAGQYDTTVVDVKRPVAA
jgi:hypothetical protein